MDAYRSYAPGQRASWIARSARQICRVFSEINWANKRATMLRLGYDLADPDRGPDTYAEFLLRSRVTMLHEPPARRRSAGRQVR